VCLKDCCHNCLRVGPSLSKGGCHPARMRKCYLYPTDLSDAQWKLLEPLLPKVKNRGRPPTDRRLILNGLLYFVRSGCAWRLLPREFGPWETVYGCFRTWRRQGLWKFIHEVLRRIVRRQAGKRSQPTAAILDSQTVRSADHGGPRGYDAGKKIKGRMNDHPYIVIGERDGWGQPQRFGINTSDQRQHIYII